MILSDLAASFPPCREEEKSQAASDSAPGPSVLLGSVSEAATPPAGETGGGPLPEPLHSVVALATRGAEAEAQVAGRPRVLDALLRQAGLEVKP